MINQKQVQRVVKQLEHVIREICAPLNGLKKLAELEMVSKDDLYKIWNWNAVVPKSVDQCVHDMIAETIQRQSAAAPAVCAWDGDITYGELDDHSTRLALCLLQLGVKAGSMVVLYFEKSKWTVVAMLAVMKAGGASVLLDSTQPEERLRMIISQVAPGYLLTSSANEQPAKKLVDQLDLHTSIVVVNNDTLAQLSSSTTKIQLPSIKPSDTLFLIFTSGSTGIPKGAVISHANASSTMKHQQQQRRLTSSSRVYDFASYAFDVAWSNALMTLYAEGCLCVPSEDDRRGNIE